LGLLVLSWQRAKHVLAPDVAQFQAASWRGGSALLATTTTTTTTTETATERSCHGTTPDDPRQQQFAIVALHAI
jgi:hypothetical protein